MFSKAFRNLLSPPASWGLCSNSAPPAWELTTGGKTRLGPDWKNLQSTRPSSRVSFMSGYQRLNRSCVIAKCLLGRIRTATLTQSTSSYQSLEMRVPSSSTSFLPVTAPFPTWTTPRITTFRHTRYPSAQTITSNC